jgi:hypothetical protein
MKASICCAVSSHHISRKTFLKRRVKEVEGNKTKKSNERVYVVGMKLNLIMAI